MSHRDTADCCASQFRIQEIIKIHVETGLIGGSRYRANMDVCVKFKYEKSGTPEKTTCLG